MSTLGLNNKTFLAWRQKQIAKVDAKLGELVGVTGPASLRAPMCYAVFNGGKRLRALLLLASCQAFKLDNEQMLRAACAIELIHAYSLVHDDMPCMDNDQLRRGKPTVHVQFGESSALLTGDALQALAFEVLTPPAITARQARLQAKLCRILALAAGAAGMAGGQAIDLDSVQSTLDEQQLQQMHKLKTGALIHAAVMMGCAGANVTAHIEQQLSDFAWSIGIAFQVIDDVLDEVATTAELGKTAGKDKAAGKPTYVSLMGLETAKDYAQQLLTSALNKLTEIDANVANTKTLQQLAYFVIARSN